MHILPRIVRKNALLFVLVVGLAPATYAQFTSGTISVDFNSDIGGATIAPTQNAIVTPGTWNEIDAGANVPVTASGATALNDSTGMLSNVSLSYTADGSYNVDPYLGVGKANSPNLGLLEDFIFSSSTTAPSTITLTGLSAGATYNLYLYEGGNQNGRSTVFTVGGLSQTAVYQNTDTTFVNGDNYVQYLGVAPTSGGVLTFTYAQGAGEGDFAGFQLMATATGVPEPSSIALMAIGGAALAGHALRRRGAMSR